MSYATVGQNKQILEENGMVFKESIIMLSHIMSTAFHQVENGALIIYADASGLILGAEIFAPNAEELISPVAMALAGSMTASMAQQTIMAHPTFSEILERAYFGL
jgi:dihydrolipoamide dehydrogenase